MNKTMANSEDELVAQARKHGTVRTIPKNSRQIATLQSELTKCRVFTLENNFSGQDVEPKWAWQALYSALRAKLTERDGTYTVHVHDNRWYELTRG